MCYNKINYERGEIMPISRAKRAANNRWDAENMQIVACKIKKTDAEKFKECAKANGTTPNALLKDFIFRYISDDSNIVQKSLDSAE